jgi:hypothetical protein
MLIWRLYITVSNTPPHASRRRAGNLLSAARWLHQRGQLVTASVMSQWIWPAARCSRSLRPDDERLGRIDEL